MASARINDPKDTPKIEKGKKDLELNKQGLIYFEGFKLQRLVFRFEKQSEIKWSVM